MSLRSLLPLLTDDPAVVAARHGSDLVAVPNNARAAFLASIAEGENQPIVVVTPTMSEAELLLSDLRKWSDRDVTLFPAWETLPFERVSPSVETMGQRLAVMHQLRDKKAPVVVTSIKAVLQRLGPHVEDTAPLVIKRGATIDFDELIGSLGAAGYRREYQVEHRGEFSTRGSIVDVFPSTADDPIRLDLWGDEVDRLSKFTVNEQRSTQEIEQIEIFAARELRSNEEVQKRAEQLLADEPWAASQWERFVEGAVFDGMESFLPWLVRDEHVLLDLLDDKSRVVLVEPRRLRDRGQELLDEEAALADALAQTWSVKDTTEFPRLHVSFDRLLSHSKAAILSLPTTPDSPDTPMVTSRGWETSGSALAQQITGLLKKHLSIVVCADGKGTANRISESLRDEGVVAPFIEKPKKKDLQSAGCRVIAEPIERGFLWGDRLAVLSETDITGRRRPHRRAKTRARVSQTFYDDLKPGDFVVHYHHGVGRFAGMVTRSLGGSERDYLLLAYRGDDKLYIPSDQIDAIRPYTGGDTPSLSKLGGSDWEKTKSHVRKAVEEIAQELLVIYQRRVHSKGHAFAQDTPWQQEMEDTFPFHETPDQMKAIIDVKADMEEEQPMDRLVCGDVGFGKTEVALRAVFKAVQDGKQAAILVPTTLLAQQHFSTFSDRFAGFPVRVEVLSRFLTNAEARKVIKELAEGKVDVIIGTHRLLSEDVKFKDLGLLVVDEEQRFGVMHKEAMKKLRADVDVLTLTATPIPRTLELSLTGIRDLTLLNTPPAERQPILTFVGEYDDRAVSESIRRELLREGQVFFVHNRVRDIEDTAAHLKELVPEARIAIAHGQMDEGTLEKVVLDFWHNKYDVLVCTTIIESGIDMPTVNTLVVDRADLLGLGQLHQIRGRVGRSGQRAYAYLFFPPDRSLSEEAYERLRTIGENTELGSGFKIAMRDLEIRGAGNLLSGNQSGHIAAVGYDLYVQMVNESVAELKGEELREPAEIKLDLPVKAFLPSDYVGREDLRLDAYRRLAVVESTDGVADIRKEWVDRFGAVPEPAEMLLEIGELRARCVRLGITDISIAKGVARIASIELKASQTIRLTRKWPKALYKPEAQQLVFPLAKGINVTQALVQVLDILAPADEKPELASSSS